MRKIEIYDPPLCCPTGICGPAVDPALVRFAADLDWLKGQGVAVERYNLAQQPGAFAANPTVRAELAAAGNTCLPLILVDGAVASRGCYPDRPAFAALAGIVVPETGLADATSGAMPTLANLSGCCTPGSGCC